MTCYQPFVLTSSTISPTNWSNPIATLDSTHQRKGMMYITTKAATTSERIMPLMMHRSLIPEQRTDTERSLVVVL